MDLYQALGAHIRHHRRALDMSQETLAARVDVPLDIIGKIERGTTTSSFETVQKIAAALILPPLALFGASEVEVPTSTRASRARILAIFDKLDESQLARAAKVLEAFAETL